MTWRERPLNVRIREGRCFFEASEPTPEGPLRFCLRCEQRVSRYNHGCLCWACHMRVEQHVWKRQTS